LSGRFSLVLGRQRRCCVVDVCSGDVRGVDVCVVVVGIDVRGNVRSVGFLKKKVRSVEVVETEGVAVGIKRTKGERPLSEWGLEMLRVPKGGGGRVGRGDAAKSGGTSWSKKLRRTYVRFN
jgi:hypothetical protein